MVILVSNKKVSNLKFNFFILQTVTIKTDKFSSNIYYLPPKGISFFINYTNY